MKNPINTKTLHIPVLLEEVLNIFNKIEKGIVVDCTLGFGGHTQALLEQNPNICVIGIDKDQQARDFAIDRLKNFGERFQCVGGSFGETFKEILSQYGYLIKGVLADIGVSSFQIDSKDRGFGFQTNSLDMRMDTQAHLNAYMVVNNYSNYELQRILRDYGEIKEYKKMANLIVERRTKKPFDSTQDLSEFIQSHFKNSRIHPATLAFQAIRIEVNDELNELKKLLINAKEMKGGIFGIISFHSLEDRLVKNAFKEWSKSCVCEPLAYKCICGGGQEKGIILTKKPLVASMQECRKNPRSRSAKLRAFAFKDYV